MVYIESYDIHTPMGTSIENCFEAMKNGKTGIKPYTNSKLSDIQLSASLFQANYFDSILNNTYSRLEKLGIITIEQNIKHSGIKINGADTVFILSSTKGNVELLEYGNNPKPKGSNDVELWKSAQKIADYFSIATKPLVVSNACVSGVAALMLGQRLIEMGEYKNAIILGIDLISKFIVSGFQSFKALSSDRCKPFDSLRNGLNLGEGAGVIVLSNEKTANNSIAIAGAASSNDANHISGPSRTGEGLLIAIKKALGKYKDVDFISAHGTATMYNDDMESKAIHRAGLNNIPVNSFKAYFGHTLGAAGIIESIVSLESMKQAIILPTLGLNDIGTAEKINVIKEIKNIELNNVLKLTSGFGGTNAVVYFRKT